MCFTKLCSGITDPGDPTMLPNPHALKIYVDGSALRNPGGPGGCAGIVEYPDDWNQPDEEVFRVGYKATTNNRMELIACIRAFDYVRENGARLGVQMVLVITDSLYVYENHRRAPAWRGSNWRTLAGRPVENSDLWKNLMSVQSKARTRTEIKWIKGKTLPIQKAVDRAAKEAARQPWEIDRGFRPGKVARSKIAVRGASILFPACGQEAVIWVYRSALPRKAEHTIFFHRFSEEKQEFVDKFRAYANPAQAAELHRSHSYRVRFNSNPQYPVITSVLEQVS